MAYLLRKLSPKRWLLALLVTGVVLNLFYILSVQYDSQSSVQNLRGKYRSRFLKDVLHNVLDIHSAIEESGNSSKDTSMNGTSMQILDTTEKSREEYSTKKTMAKPALVLQTEAAKERAASPLKTGEDWKTALTGEVETSVALDKKRRKSIIPSEKDKANTAAASGLEIVKTTAAAPAAKVKTLRASDKVKAKLIIPSERGKATTATGSGVEKVRTTAASPAEKVKAAGASAPQKAKTLAEVADNKAEITMKGSVTERANSVVSNVKRTITTPASPSTKISPTVASQKLETKMDFKEIKRHRSEIACQIPKLDPFDKAIMKHIKKIDKLKCSGKYYAKLEGGYLSLKIDNVLQAYFQYIMRPPMDDWNVMYSKKIPLLEMTSKEMGLVQGNIGCLVNGINDSIGLNTIAVQNGGFNFFSENGCAQDKFWHLLSDGKIKHYVENKCISLNKLCERADCSLVFLPCKDAQGKFEIKEEKYLMETKSQRHLKLVKFGNKREGKLILTSKNHSNIEWRMIKVMKQNIDIRTKVKRDFVRVTILKDEGIKHEFFAEVRENPRHIERANNATMKASLPYNVALFMIDSQSASNVKRQLAKTYNYLKNDRDTFIFDGHTVVGDSTTPQLCAILIGKLEDDLPEGRRGYRGGKAIDDWPFIMKNFTDRGYVTLLNEEEPWYGAFHYRLHGFRQQPTDHYSRPFWMDCEQDRYWEGTCVGDIPIVQKTTDYTQSFLNGYKGIPKLAMTFFSAMCHNTVNMVQNMDEDSIKNLERMNKTGLLNDTILIVMGDHGMRASDFRATLTGKLEQRLPFLSITLPSSLLSKYPNIRDAMQHNSKLLTSHFDLHATLQHLFTFPNDPKVLKGQSLFSKIDARTRTCETAGIKEHWCTCLQFTEQNTTEKHVIKLAEAVVTFINQNITGMIPQAKEKCAKLELKDVNRAGRKVPNSKVQKFKETESTSICTDCGLVLAEKADLTQGTQVFELVFTVKPSDGTYEATVTVKEDSITVNPDIARLNLYGNQPKCVQDQYPHLRKFCYCTNKG